MKHSAWLSATPEKMTKSRREMRGDEMPPLNEGGYLVRILFEVGPVQPAGMGGSVAISDQDLRAWQENQDVQITPWECSTIRALSREYAGQMAESVKASCPPPWVPQAALSTEQRQAVSAGFELWAERLNAQQGKIGTT